jgi:hypothetical protein
MEFLVRLGGYKYMRKGICEGYSESLEKLLEDGLKIKL